MKTPKRAAREIDARREIARQDLATAFAQIFTPRINGKREWVESRINWQGGHIELAGPELDATDLAVLLAVSLIASRVGAAVLHGSDTTTARVTIHAKKAEIAALIDRKKTDGSAGRRIDEALTRIMGIVITVKSGVTGETVKEHLVEYTRERGKKIKITLNSRASRAVLGEGPWAPIDLSRFRKATPLQRIVMHRLAAHCTGGAPRNVGLERLAETCWARPSKNAADVRKRKARVKDALEKAMPHGWWAECDQRGMLRFRRV